MSDTYFTIGMAGHIDHGKTTLTKALTNVETDRLKEEKERKVSIEPGYAPLHIKEDSHISIVDVPGHERFIRQMIAGVAGIDLIILVIAADEGVMPQTKEHLQILEFLGVQQCIIAVSKIDHVDEELLTFAVEDIKENLEQTVFTEAPLICVDSVSGKGIDALQQAILQETEKTEYRDTYGSFRLPIDQVFTVKGQGTIVRGTIYEGIVQKDSKLTILPEGYKTRPRQIQAHNQEKQVARAGQRTAINLGGIEKNDIQRGDVLVSSDHFLVTNTIDVSLQLVDNLSSPLKQRMPVKVHAATSEVMGKIVFFDRNEASQTNDSILCQIRLAEDIVVRRGDRFILRRPSPVETLGGGWVIEPKGGKYRFGEATVDMLRQRKEGTPEDRIKDALATYKLLDLKQLIQHTSLNELEIKAAVDQGIETGELLNIPGNRYALAEDLTKLWDTVKQQVDSYHTTYPMRLGIGKAEMTQSLRQLFPNSLIQYGLDAMVAAGDIIKDQQFLALPNFTPHFPAAEKSQMEALMNRLRDDGLYVKKWDDYAHVTTLSKEWFKELGTYIIHTRQAYPLTDDLLVHHQTVTTNVETLKAHTSTTFGLKEAKNILQVSRKYLIPFLELLDQLKITIRNEDERKWKQ